jgi:hypothetical protein
MGCEIYLGMRLTMKHWRCGGILCSVCPAPLLIKDKKLIFYSDAQHYSSDETEDE